MGSLSLPHTRIITIIPAVSFIMGMFFFQKIHRQNYRILLSLWLKTNFIHKPELILFHHPPNLARYRHERHPLTFESIFLTSSCRLLSDDFRHQYPCLQLT